MILAIDMGNSNIVVGGIDNKQIYFLERITTHTTRTELEYCMYIKGILDIHGVKANDIEGAILSSVVPPLNITIRNAVKKILGIEHLKGWRLLCHLPSAFLTYLQELQSYTPQFLL